MFRSLDPRITRSSDLFQNGKVAGIPGQRHDAKLMPDFAQRGIVDVGGIMQPQLAATNEKEIGCGLRSTPTWLRFTGALPAQWWKEL